MKLTLLFVILALSGVIAHMSTLLSKDSWSAANMARAYEQGCVFGRAPIDKKDMYDCMRARWTYESTILYSETVN